MSMLTGIGIWEKFNSLKSDRQVVIMHYAIDAMKQDNKRTKTECVALAMGYRRLKENQELYFLMPY